MPKAFVIYMLLLAAVITMSLTTWALAGFYAAYIVSMLGTVLATFGTLAYAAIWHSRTRWPELSARQRLANIVAFTR